jgi:hypothetical protein
MDPTFLSATHLSDLVRNARIGCLLIGPFF